jgi:hypothetical protein
MSTITLSLSDLETMIRRVIREELARHTLSVLDDSSQEGPDDPAGDEELLADALIVLEQYKDKPEAWTDWEDFKAELASAEASGELPQNP